jgi:hypothetical protein
MMLPFTSPPDAPSASFDTLPVARRAGTMGRAIGVDMTSEMIARSRRKAERLGDVESSPGRDRAPARLDRAGPGRVHDEGHAESSSNCLNRVMI